MSLIENLLGKLPVGSLIQIGIGYVSEIAERVSPDELSEEDAAKVQKWVGSVYAVLKNFGKDLVESTDNDLDDKGYEELVEVCEQAADRYNLQLDATSV